MQYERRSLGNFGATWKAFTSNPVVYLGQEYKNKRVNEIMLRSLVQYNKVKFCIGGIWLKSRGWGGGLLPVMAYREAPPKRGTHFEASGIWNSRDLTSWTIREGRECREICHCGCWEGLKRANRFNLYGLVWFLDIQKWCIYSN